MLVKAKEGQVSFLFQEQDPFFEIGFSEKTAERQGEAYLSGGSGEAVTA